MTPPAAAIGVPDDELLWRRIHQNQYVPDGQGGMRVSTAAFIDQKLSVDRSLVVLALGHDHSYTRQSGAAVAQFSAGLARTLGQEVVADPEPDNPAHALVVGDKKPGGRRVARTLAQSAVILQ